MARQVLENGVILPAEYSDDWYDDMTSNLTKLDDVIGSNSEKLSSADVGAAALSNNYNDLDNLPTIPTVNDATLTIQKNGVDVQTFTANASSNVTANITVPTKTSDLTNDSNFVDTSNSAVASGITSAKVTSYDSHIADTDIHVTTADKTKWNNGVSQSYVLRYSSSSVTDNSTIAFSTLDNTDNIKSGDKVIDMDGKIFSVVSVDTANQTVTVGSALIDIALDSNVVHTSGNETVGGAKTFDDNLTIYNSDGTQTPKGLTIKNAQWSMGESGSTTVSNINFLDKNSSVPASVMASKGLYGQSYLRFSVRTKDSQNNTYSEEIYYDIDTSGNVEFRSWHDNIVSFGTSTYKWKDVQTNLVNGLTPSSLGMPSGNIADQVDISGYFTNIGSGNTNSYTALANGWIYLRLGDISSCQATVYDANNNRMWGQSSTGSVEQLTIPILKGQTLSTKWNTTLSVNVTNAKFIPCQGNI